MNEEKRAEIHEYVNRLFAPEDETLQWVKSQCREQGLPPISVQPHEGRLLQMLMLLIGARRVVEIGTLGGYSGIWLARALPTDGRIYTLEIDSKHAAVARSSFERAGVSERVKILVGDARENLQSLEAAGPHDFIFIDADKVGYPQYLDWSIANLRAGGVVCAHNALRRGAVIEPEGEDNLALAAFNNALAEDERLESHLFAVGDGLAVAIRR